MDSEALARRIAAATEAQKKRIEQQQAAARRAEAAAANPRPSIRKPQPSTIAAESSSHVAAILQGQAPVEPGPESEFHQTAPQHPMHAQIPGAPQPQTVVPAQPAAQPVQYQQVQSEIPQAVPTQMVQAPAAIDQISPSAPTSVPVAAPMTEAIAPAAIVTEPTAPSDISTANIDPDRQSIGRLTQVDGSYGVVTANVEFGQSDMVSVGHMLSLQVSTSRIVALVSRLEQDAFSEETRIYVELQGEIELTHDGEKFRKGIRSYPPLGTIAHKIATEDLSAIYAASGSNNVVVGTLAQEKSIPAYLDVEAMLSKHFAVLGSTGCGKSSSVSLLLRTASEAVPDLRTILLDPHNEYARAFPEARVIDATSLDLPFWLLQLDEYVECLSRGKPIDTEEIDALREFIPEAKRRYREAEDRMSLRVDTMINSLTADSPVPYRMSDVISILDEEMGMLETRYSRASLKSLKSRINAHGNDPRYRFMFRDKTISDKAEAVVDQFFHLNIPTGGITILQMSGMPSEVVNAVASLLCRLSFELCIAANGRLKVLVVCEEAHRYVPLNASESFEPTRRAIARIAKEGRKYGSFIAIVSQRPAELDPTILSQCSTVFAMRLSNDHDQDLIRKAISSSSASTIAFLSALASREAIAFGEAFSTPMRLRFKDLPPEWLPGTDHSVFNSTNALNVAQQPGLIFRTWRGEDTTGRPGTAYAQGMPRGGTIIAAS